MLCLTQKEGQTFTVGDKIRVVVKRAQHGQVMLGFEAPKDVVILREDTKERERKES